MMKYSLLIAAAAILREASADCTAYISASRAASNGAACLACVNPGCAFANGECYNSCDEVSAKMDCFAIDNFVGLDGKELCELATGEEVVVPEPEPATDAPTKAPTPEPVDTQEGVQVGIIGGSACISDCPEIGPPEEVEVPETPVEVPPVDVPETLPAGNATGANATTPCNGLPTCSSCLSARMSCVWTAGVCEEQCIADADCWSPTYQVNMTPPEICDMAANKSEAHVDEGMMDEMVAARSIDELQNSAALSTQQLTTVLVSLAALWAVVA